MSLEDGLGLNVACLTKYERRYNLIRSITLFLGRINSFTDSAPPTLLFGVLCGAAATDLLLRLPFLSPPGGYPKFIPRKIFFHRSWNSMLRSRVSVSRPSKVLGSDDVPSSLPFLWLTRDRSKSSPRTSFFRSHALLTLGSQDLLKDGEIGIGSSRSANLIDKGSKEPLHVFPASSLNSIVVRKLDGAGNLGVNATVNLYTNGNRA
mmetsp:Transcript_22494/g.36155  ORF Transcript_22494/g.36155 Transcript_22494/m.36155 type:complete len:206 (-) Transcript_22494:253-870(-)